jgi:4'-phosphopantetheinyl transferase EntD
MEITDGNGRVAARLMRSTRRPVMGEADLLREHPRQAKIRELLGVTQPFALTQVEIAPLAAALEGNDETVLNHYLSGAERAHFQTLLLPKRRQEWLAGRIAAKTAIRILFVPDVPDANTISIMAGEDGAPCVTLEEPGMTATPFVSITHSGGLAGALATSLAGFGIDVQTIGGVAAEIENEFCAPGEAALVRTAVADGDAALTCLWAAKEACRKAVGAAGTASRDVILREAECRAEYLVFRFEHERAGAIRCVAFHDPEYAYAVAGPAPVGIRAGLPQTKNEQSLS